MASSENTGARKKPPPGKAIELLKLNNERKRKRAKQDLDITYEPIINSDSDTDSDEPIQCDTQNAVSAVSCNELGTGKRKRKKRRQPEIWKSNVKKLARNSGKEYIDYKGRVVHEKQLPELSSHACKRKCQSKISEDDMKKAHESFWKLADHTAQNAFVFASVQQQIKARNCANATTPQDRKKPKSMSRHFTLAMCMYANSFFWLSLEFRMAG